METSGSDHGFRSVAEEPVHRGYAFELVVGTFEAPDGSRFTRDVIHHDGAVGVLPVHEDGTATLVRQYRGPLGTTVLEIPAGVRDVDGEPTEVTAARELAEETGLAAERIELLCRFHNAPGISDEEVWVYAARGLHSVDLDLQGPEEQHMHIERHRLEDLVAMIGRGELTDAKSVIAVLLATRDA